jgi:hypothetical protein
LFPEQIGADELADRNSLIKDLVIGNLTASLKYHFAAAQVFVLLENVLHPLVGVIRVDSDIGNSAFHGNLIDQL